MTARGPCRHRVLRPRRGAPGAAPRRADAGFTLVEVLVALFLFSIIAMAATALTATSTRALVVSDTALAGLDQIERTRAIMGADLGQAARRPSATVEGGQLPAFTLTPEGFVLVRRGLSGVMPSVEKVAWGYDGANWLRQAFPRVDGTAPGAAVVLATGLSGVRLRVMTDDGWAEQWVPIRPESLPRALEVTLQRTDGRIVTLVLPVAG